VNKYTIFYRTSQDFTPDFNVVSKSRCPLLLARGVSACLWFFLPLNREGKTVVGAVGKWESRVFCGIPKRSVFSTACWPLLLVGKQAHPVRPVVHTQPSGQMLAHQHPASRQRPAPARALDLQNAIGEADGVVAVDHPLVLQRENTLQLFPTRGHKSALRLRCPHRKLAVEFRNVTLPQEPIGFFSRGDPPQPQLLRQAPLPGPEVSLTPSAGLRRIRGNHRDSQFAQGPPHLGEPLPVHHLPGFRCQPEVAGAIAIQRAENPTLLHHLAQRQLHPTVAEQEAVLLPKLFVKMPHTEIKILLPVQGQHALHYRKRYPPRRRLPGAPVVETVVTIGPVPVIQPPQLPRTQPQYLGGLKPMNLLADGPQNHFLYFHRPLHGDPGVNHPGNLPECGLHPAASQKRTFHMLIKRTYHVLTTPLPNFD